MAYESFDHEKPNPTQPGITDYSDGIRHNLLAVRDGVMLGLMPGWSMEPQNSDGTTPPSDPAQPDVLLYSHGDERLELSITWGSSGGADGNPTSIAYRYSADAGSSWESIGTEAITYDSDGNVTGTTWS